MKKSDLAQNLAVSLTSGAWSAEEIRVVLERRLPPVMRKHAAPLGAEIYAACPAAYAPTARVVAAVLAERSDFDRVYGYCRRYDVWPDPDLTAPRMAPIAAFSDLPLPQLPTEAALAQWLGLPQERLRYHADPSARYERHGETSVNHYHYNLLRKSSGGLRLIEAPKQRLKAMQRLILRGILDHVPLHPDTFGFARGRNCLDAAARHVGEEVVICMDIRNFFPSINAGRVFGLFRALGYPNAVARALTGLCTTRTPHRVLEGLSETDRRSFNAVHLPQGAPTSPALANLVAFTLDLRLSALARRVGVQFSRYADDIAFSGDRRVAPMLLRMADSILRDEGFIPNPRKTRMMSVGSRQMVTGVVVNAHLNVPRGRFDRLKAIIHACGRSDDARLNDPIFRAKLVGEIDWVFAVNRARGEKLRHLLAKAVEKTPGS